jgi:hypothetical protein
VRCRTDVRVRRYKVVVALLRNARRSLHPVSGRLIHRGPQQGDVGDRAIGCEENAESNCAAIVVGTAVAVQRAPSCAGMIWLFRVGGRMRPANSGARSATSLSSKAGTSAARQSPANFPSMIVRALST